MLASTKVVTITTANYATLFVLGKQHISKVAKNTTSNY